MPAVYSHSVMNITRRRGAIALFITLGVLLTGLTVFLNIAWILREKRHIAFLVVGIILFAALIAGVVLNTVFLVREVRRNERQDSFLNAVTHELKTPIASIRLYLETLQRRPVPDDKRQEFYRIMLSDSDRLLATVDQVLQAGEATHRPHKDIHRVLVDLAPLVAECIALTLSRHHLPPQAISLADVPGNVALRVLGSPADLATAVTNLLDNAVKYSAGNVHIRCQLAISDYNRVALTITDSGIGVAPQDLKRIFKRFYRAQDVALRQVKGTGLGLFIVRSIARQHGGDITAQSPGQGHGTTMRLELPLASTTAPSA
ncbi:MAG TPA: HAMP domain-containing sensor histidine kinase [Acidobacteriaceae bacterium]|nr:HAMP domain-containing sensor histidine kinase [Acidobacteriaceae bacterium]